MNERASKHSVFAVLVVALMLISPGLLAAPWILEQADSPEPISEEQVSELEQRARGGDWNLKLEFAAAWLYETHYPEVYGCKRLRYGFRCRAMAKREASGMAFLHEIIDTTPPNEEARIDVAAFQDKYARTIRIGDASPDSAECKEAVRYFMLAIKNGSRCTAQRLADMARFGTCLPKDMRTYYQYMDIADGCPVY